MAFQMCYDAIIMCLLEEDFDICIGLLIIHVELVFHILRPYICHRAAILLCIYTYNRYGILVVALFLSLCVCHRVVCLCYSTSI